MARRSIRFRITAAAALLVLIATAAGAVLFVLALQQSLEAGVRSNAEADAASLAAQVATGGPSAVSLDPDADGRLYQVVGAGGTVLASSTNAAGAPLAFGAVSTGTVTVDGVQFALVARSATRTITTGDPTPSPAPSASETGDDHGGSSGSGSDDPGGSGKSGSGKSGSNSGSGGSGGGDDSGGDGIPATPASQLTAQTSTSYLVVTGRTLAGIGDTVSTTARLLAIAVPVLVVFIALLTWFTVARALRPVDRMRAELDALGSSSLDRRIAEPRTRDEIGRLAVTMNALLERLDSSQRAQRRFVSDASHELKSPLAALRQYAEVATAHPDRIGYDELSAAVLDEGARLERLVQGMLVLARADEHGLVAASAPVDLDDIVLAEAARVRTAGIRSMDASRVHPVRVQGDVGMLAQVARNLVDNAVRHASTTVRLALEEHAGSALLVVEDDGDGVSPELREQIFDRFVRLDEARSRDAGGSGLGLAIVRELVAAHGGTIAVTDAMGGGARFEVRLPLRRS